MKNYPTRSNPKGFTLTELLVVIAIIAVLASVAFVGYKRSKSIASAAVDSSDMRSIATAVISYAGDNNGKLPISTGGIMPKYSTHPYSLNSYIGPYLGYEDSESGTFMKELASANWQKMTNNQDAPSLLAHHNIYTGNGKPTSIVRPQPYIKGFGYPGENGHDSGTLAKVMGQAANISNAIMFSEIDKLHPEFRSSTPSWLAGIPDGMAHGTYRLAVYWDGHVGRVDVDLNPL